MKSFVLPLAAAGLVIALAGCKSEQDQLAEFNAAFLKSCETDATGHGVPASIAKPACDCALGEFDKKYPGAEKITKPLSEVAPMVQACAQKVATGG